MITHLKTTLLTIFMMLSFVAANAQIDLKKLGKKVTEKVDKKKDQVKTEKAEEIVAKPDLSKQDSKVGVYDYRKKYKPSAEALAADPKASDQTIEPGFTKSISEIHAAYEQFDPKLYPYQPYYKYKDFYYLHDDNAEKEYNGQYDFLMRAIARLPAGVSYNMPYKAIKTPAGDEVFVTYDELFRSARTAQFIADPLSTSAFHKYVQVVMFEDNFFKYKYAYNMADKMKGIVNAKTGMLLFAPSENVYVATQENRRELALSLARTVVPIDNIRSHVNELIEKYKAEKNPLMKYTLGFQIMGIMDNIFTKHKDYNSSDATNRKIEASYMVVADERFKNETNAYSNFAATVEMPKGVQIDGATSSKVNSMAKQSLGSEYVKTIFLSNKWSEFQESKFPYRVMHLSLPVAVIVKRGDKYLMNYYDITKSPNGGEWNMMVKMGATFQPVNYK